MAVATRAAPRPRAVPRRRITPEAGGRALRRIGMYAFLIALAILFVAPFGWMVVASLEPLSEMFHWPPTWFPRDASFKNYTDFFRPPPNTLIETHVDRWVLNSFFIAGTVMVGQLFFSSLAAYCYAKRRFPGRNFLFMLMIATMMIPFPVLMIPNYLVLKHIPLFGGNDIFGAGGHGWIDSYWGLIAPSLVSGFSVFLLTQYMKSIPDELLDAARVDGASEFQIYSRIVLPLSRPALAAVGIFTFQFFWNDFLWPLILLSDPHKYTLPLGLGLLVVQNKSLWNLLMPGTVIATVPLLLIFLFFQRYFVRGISVSGLKG